MGHQHARTRLDPITVIVRVATQAMVLLAMILTNVLWGRVIVAPMDRQFALIPLDHIIVIAQVAMLEMALLAMT